MIYEPREDSYLLAEVVSTYAHGSVLDVGTGSGIQAQTAQECKQVTSVQAVDINPEAVTVAKENGVDAYQSDMFEKVSGKYDTIICNTPYLPDEPLAPDIALDGGQKGFEWTKKFLQEIHGSLKRDGQILLLISTLTNQHVIEETLQKQTFEYKIVSREKLGFEELLVYRIHYALPNRPNAAYLAHGRRSVVYRDDKEVIKVAQPRRVQQEALMLQKVNEHGLGPTYISHTNNQLCMQYIPGKRIDHYLDSHSQEEIECALTQVQQQLVVLDSLDINKSELKNPYKHVIVSPDGPVLIDWERAKYSQRTQNSRQFNEYLKRIGYKHLI
jgi:HemK-related putative methylase